MCLGTSGQANDYKPKCKCQPTPCGAKADSFTLDGMIREEKEVEGSAEARWRERKDERKGPPKPP